MSSYYTEEELKAFNFKSLGKNVLISRKSSIYGATRISIGNHVRIDDFCFLSPGENGIFLGSYIHIAPYCNLAGKGKITMDDFSGISAKGSIFSSSDDYSGGTLTNPMVPDKYKKVHHGDVLLSKHVIVGAQSIILPGVTIGIGSAIGALSLVSKNVEPFKIAVGNPLKVIKDRKVNLLELEEEFRKDPNF
ncbi:MAG: acyltransferase [Ferruginibacter sp.]